MLRVTQVPTGGHRIRTREPSWLLSPTLQWLEIYPHLQKWSQVLWTYLAPFMLKVPSLWILLSQNQKQGPKKRWDSHCLQVGLRGTSATYHVQLASKHAFFLWLHHTAYRVSVSWPGFELGLLQWKPGVLITRPPGNSLNMFIVWTSLLIQ